MIEREFTIGKTVDWVETLKTEANDVTSVFDLTGHTYILTFNDVDRDGTDFSKDSTSDTDWLSISDATAGQVTVTLTDRPTGVPLVGATYVVGFAAVKGSARVTWPNERWTFSVPREGLYGDI